MNRRDFLSKSCSVIGVAGAFSRLVPTALNAQSKIKPIDKPGRYEDSLIVERKPSFTWPGGKTLAVWIVPNVEIWYFNSTGGGVIGSTAGSPPDVMNYAWRDYGLRVGLWRIAEVMEAAGVRATVALNSAVCETFPKIIDEMKKLNWEFMGHGITNSESLSKLSLEDEKDVVHTVLTTIEKATGKRPRGWLGPGLAETFNTPDVLAEEGVVYVGDWNNDDQPYPLKVKKGKLISLSYCMEVNDIPLYARRGYTGEQYLRTLTDQFDTLYAESQKLPKVLGIGIHPYLTGQALHKKYFQQAIAHMQQQERVWFATGSEITDAYLRSQS